MSLIKGIHHVALKCCSEQEYEKTKHFYTSILIDIKQNYYFNGYKAKSLF